MLLRNDSVLEKTKCSSIEGATPVKKYHSAVPTKIVHLKFLPARV